MNTKKIIADSMFSLLKTKSFEKITIEMVLNESKVSRSSFYRYFNDKYELMNWCYQSYVDTLLIMVYNGTENWRNTLFLIFRFLNDNHEYFEQAVKVQGRNSFSDFLYNYSYEFYKNIYLNKTNEKTLTAEARVALEFNCCGAVYIVKEWLKNGRKEPVAEIAEWSFQLIPEMFRKYLEAAEQFGKACI